MILTIIAGLVCGFLLIWMVSAYVNFLDQSNSKNSRIRFLVISILCALILGAKIVGLI